MAFSSQRTSGYRALERQFNNSQTVPRRHALINKLAEGVAERPGVVVVRPTPSVLYRSAMIWFVNKLLAFEMHRTATIRDHIKVSA